MKWRDVWLVLALALVPAAGCARPTSSARGFTKAVVERPVAEEGRPVFDEAGLVRMERRTVTDPGQVAALAAYFPGVGEGRVSPSAGGWKAGYWVKFERADGSSVTVTVDGDGRSWSEGRGDWHAAPRLKERLDAILAEPAGHTTAK